MRNPIPELSREYWLETFRDFYFQDGMLPVVKVAAKAVRTDKYKVLLAIHTVLIQREKAIKLRQFVCALNKLSVDYYGRKVVEIRDSPNAFWEASNDAISEGIVWTIIDLGVENIEWLEKNVTPDEINRTEVKQTISQADTLYHGGIREKRKNFRDIAKQLWGEGQRFSLGLLEKISKSMQMSRDIEKCSAEQKTNYRKPEKFWVQHRPVVWLSEMIFEERGNHEHKKC